MGSNPVEASDVFLGFLCNCLSYFITAKITFTSILYPQFTHDLYHINFTFSEQFAQIIILVRMEYEVNDSKQTNKQTNKQQQQQQQPNEKKNGIRRKTFNLDFFSRHGNATEREKECN